MRTIGLHLFASVKGGVGKSTLAVASAKLLAARGRAPVVVDSDVLGSSLADGLELCSPVVTTSVSGPDYMAPPSGRWHGLDDSRELRQERKQWWQDRKVETSDPPPLTPPYVNDALFFPNASADHDCRVDAMLWRHAVGDGVRYLPSSPIRNEASRAAALLSGGYPEFAWVRRVAWILDGLITHDFEVTDVVIDLPPGTWGITHETLVLASRLADPLPRGYPRWDERVAWDVHPTIVTTADRNDRVLALEYWLHARNQIPELRVVMNRTTASHAALRAAIRSDLPKPLDQLSIEDEVEFVPALPETLGHVFVNGDLSLTEDIRELERPLLGNRGEDV